MRQGISNRYLKFQGTGRKDRGNQDGNNQPQNPMDNNLNALKNLCDARFPFTVTKSVVAIKRKLAEHPAQKRRQSSGREKQSSRGKAEFGARFNISRGLSLVGAASATACKPPRPQIKQSAEIPRMRSIAAETQWFKPRRRQTTMRQ